MSRNDIPSIIKDKKQQLLFIPLFSEDDIFLEYTYTEMDNLDLIVDHKFRLKIKSNGKKYVKNSKNISMHEIIFGRKAKPGYVIDHINSNGVDNRRVNLREITNSQNAYNKIKSTNNVTSKYMGVFKDKNNKWVSQIRFEYKKYHIGTFNTEEEAAKARDIYAVHFFRESARLNVDDNDDKFLTQIEIDNILQNGIPDDYKIIGKIKTDGLPKNIYKQKEKYFYRISNIFKSI